MGKAKIKLDSEKMKRAALNAKGTEVECPTCHEKVVIREGFTECPRCKTPLRYGR